jgi:signal-transduction protein with cAMP-binding, CBS, and nucleotidyltransferase domain
MSERKLIRVRDVMDAEFHTIDGMATIEQALALMKEKRVQCLIVNKRHPEDEYGLLLVSDIARQVLGRDRSPKRLNVYEVMAKPVVAVDPVMDIRYCARLFTRLDLTRTPVVQSGEVVGIVSLTDLVMRGLSEM